MAKNTDNARVSDLCGQFLIGFVIGVIIMLVGMLGAIIIMSI